MEGARIARVQATGALHSRTIENKIATEKQTKTNRRCRIFSIIQ
jgi:hypothetical protein